MTPIRQNKRKYQRFAALCATVALGATGTVIAAPVAFAAPDSVPSWFTSFEADQPQVDGGTIGEPNNTRGKALAGSLTPSITEFATNNENTPNETKEKIADLNNSTKWLAKSAKDVWVSVKLQAPTSIVKYTVTSANDAEERDPKKFRVQGSNDNSSWDDIDVQTNARFDSRYKTVTFELENPSEAYQYYRFYVDEAYNTEKNMIQVAEWELFADTSETEPVASPLELAVTGGPDTAINAKTGVGFTGVKSLGYSGGHLTDGAADYEAYIAKDINLAVAADTELSYKIFPQLDANVDYSATYAAVDLVFTDDSRMSTTEGLLDTYGYAPNSQSWGDSNLLIPAEWNSLKVDLSSAAGKTIKDVIFTYHNENRGTAKTAFSGWIDDISIAAAQPLDRNSDEGLVSLVDTRRGTNSSGGYSRGLNLPASAMPNGFNFYAPATNANTENGIYVYQKDNNSNNRPTLQGLIISHQPSYWMGDRNQLAIMPSQASSPSTSLTSRAASFTHDNEIAQPNFYQVELDNGVTASVAPADHSAIYRFDLGQDSGSVIIDQAGSSNKTGEGAKLSIDQATGVVTGWIDHGSGLSVGRSRMFVYGQFDQAVSSVKAGNGRAQATTASFTGLENNTVELRIATSFISVDQAKHNLDLEVTNASFDQVKDAATTAWNDRLGVIDVLESNPVDQQVVTIYSNLYRLNLYPNSQHENTGTNEAPTWKHASPTAAKQGNATDTTTNAQVLDGKVYVNNGFWDTYRSAWPLYSFLYPQELVDELVDGFVQQYRDGGWISRWSSPGYADLMTGTSSDVSFAEAYMAGKLDLETALEAYDAGLKNSTVRPVSTDAYSSSQVGRKGIDQSIFLGYTTDSTGQSVSWGMEGYINDYGLAQMAAALAEDPELIANDPARVEELKEEAQYLTTRWQHYVSMFDEQVIQPNSDGSTVQGGFAPRKADGTFSAGSDLDPLEWGGAYTEGNGWTFFYHVLYDVPGMAALYNQANGGGEGNEWLIKSLEAYYSQPDLHATTNSTGIHEAREARDVRLGQLGISNQISYHVPYIASAAGKPSLTQEVVREITQRIFQGADIGQGYLGDEDNGAYSAWYLFSMLGFYPLEVGSGNYTIGSPMLDKVTLWKGTDHELVITADGAQDGKVYVDGVTLNGENLETTALDGDKLRAGGTMNFNMVGEPSTWGEVQPTESVREPAVDFLSSDFGTITASGEANVSALTDNKSSTTGEYADGVAVTWESKLGPVVVSEYTITNAAIAASPTSWKLQGSNDGETWTDIDSRSEQSFRWDNQTKPFTVNEPAAYTSYRLNVDPTEGGTLVLSELELLGKAAAGDEVLLTAASGLTVQVDTPITASLGRFSGGVGTAAENFEVTAQVVGSETTVTLPITRASAGLWQIGAASDLTFPQAGNYDVVIKVTDKSAEGQPVTEAVTTIQVSRDKTLEGTFNQICLTDKGQALADCDGQGWQYDRSELKATGFEQGKTVQGNSGIYYYLPNVPAGANDNLTDDGATFQVFLPENATKLGLLGSSNEGAQTGTIVITYNDGTTQDYQVSVRDWVFFNDRPAETFASVPGRYSGTSTTHDNKGTGIFEIPAIELLQTNDGGEDIYPVSVTMPQSTKSNLKSGRMHIFAVGTDSADTTGYAALELEPKADIQIKPGESISGELAKITAGLASGKTVTASVNWGDKSGIASATVTDAVISGEHTYTTDGTYRVSITADDGIKSVTTQFNVKVAEEEIPVYEPEIVPAETEVVSGGTVSVSGTGFAPNETVVLKVVDNENTATVQADGDGNWTQTISVPTAVGPYQISALGEVSDVLALCDITVIEGDEPTPNDPIRYSGSDRYATSRMAMNQNLEEGKPVFVTTGLQYADALTASAAAGKLDGGVVLTRPDKIDPKLISDLKAKNPSEIFVVGGKQAVSDKVLNELKQVASVTRINGADRYQTAERVFDYFYGSEGVANVYLATGLDYADALAASAAAGATESPVLLVRGKDAKSLDGALQQKLVNAGVTKVTIVGGTSVMNGKLEASISSAFDEVTRVSGKTRFETTAALALELDKQFPAEEVTTVWFASGQNFPDALTAAAYAGNGTHRLFLAAKDCVCADAVSAITDRYQGKTDTHVVGGRSVMTDKVPALNICK